MDVEIKVPSLGESENEATLVSWLKQAGDPVAVDDVLAEVESDKITMEITAFEAGTLKETRRDEGDTVTPGEVIGIIEARGEAQARPAKTKTANTDESPQADKTAKAPAKPAAKAPSRAAPESVPAHSDDQPEPSQPPAPAQQDTTGTNKAQALVDKLVHTAPEQLNRAMSDNARQQERVPMTRLRKRIAERLKTAQNTAAMLTTFNEVNMQNIMDLRSRTKDHFKDRHGVGLGFMSFFAKACVYAAGKFPIINAYIDGEDVVYHNYMDVGIAVSTDKGLVVPVLRDAGMMSFAEIERGILELAGKARDGGLTPDDLKGGTFSITNGGVFGSLLSTPILNTPQSAILGMHTIQKRPVVENDQIVIRPMMYLALSYDHRLIDGKDAVQFLVKVKEYLENPAIAALDL